MKLQNPFPPHKRAVFYDMRFTCGKCGSNQQTELHHIRGRVSSSVYNGIVLCKRCHAQANHSFEEEREYLHKTKHYIDLQIRAGKYVPDEEDEKFLAENFAFYY